MIVKGIVTCWPLQTLDQHNITMVYTLMLEVGTDKLGPGPSLKDLLIPRVPQPIISVIPTEYKKDYILNTK